MANGNPIFLPPHTRTSRLPLRAQEQKAHLVLNTVSALLGQVEAGDNDSVQKQTCDTTQFKKKIKIQLSLSLHPSLYAV